LSKYSLIVKLQLSGLQYNVKMTEQLSQLRKGVRVPHRAPPPAVLGQGTLGSLLVGEKHQVPFLYFLMYVTQKK